MPSNEPRRSALDPFIRRLRLHARLAEADAAEIRNLPVLIVHQSENTPLVREGDRTAQCAVLLEGFAHRFRYTKSGKRQILSVYLPGDPVDLDHMYLARADDYCETASDAVIAYVHHRDLRDLIARRPFIAEAITRAMLVDSSIFREWTVNVGQRDARARVAHLLCEISARLNALGYDLHDFPLWLTQDELADATGLTPVHINRTLKWMSDDKYIVRHGAMILLPHGTGLEEIAGFDPAYLHIHPDGPG